MKRRDFFKTFSLAAGSFIFSPIINRNNLSAKLNNLVSLNNKQTYDDNYITGLEKYNQLILEAKNQNWHLMKMSTLISRVGFYFKGTNYGSNTLELEPESVVINFEKMDCFTFVENTINIARQIKSQKYLIDDLIENIKYTRYRNGIIENYTSRLHYTSDWVLQNENNNILKNISEELGGIKHQFNFGYMTRNFKNYPILAKDNSKELIRKIETIEKYLNEKYFWIIPLDKIKNISSKIQDGDIILFAISTDGLDYGHLGFAFNDRLLHASSKKKEIILDENIFKYAKSNKKNIGISVLRIN